MENSTSPFVVRDLFPSNTLHLIYGPGGAGRSSLMFQILWDWSQGKEVFGHQSQPLPFALVSTVQTRTALRTRLKNLGMDSTKIPHRSLLEGANREDYTLEACLALARTACSDLQVLFIDGMTTLCPGNINIYREASLFMGQMMKLCYEQNLTIIGTASCGKTDQDESIRQRPLGSAAWNDYASTKISIDYADRSKPLDPERTVYILPREDAGLVLQMTIDPESHQFVILQETTPQIANALSQWLEQFQPDHELTTKEILLAGEQLNVSRATTFRWIKQWVELGLLIKVVPGTGKYRKVQKQ